MRRAERGDLPTLADRAARVARRSRSLCVTNRAASGVEFGAGVLASASVIARRASKGVFPGSIFPWRGAGYRSHSAICRSIDRNALYWSCTALGCRSATPARRSGCARRMAARSAPTPRPAPGTSAARAGGWGRAKASKTEATSKVPVAPETTGTTQARHHEHPFSSSVASGAYAVDLRMTAPERARLIPSR